MFEYLKLTRSGNCSSNNLSKSSSRKQTCQLKHLPLGLFSDALCWLRNNSGTEGLASIHSVLLAARHWKGNQRPSQSLTLWFIDTPSPQPCRKGCQHGFQCCHLSLQALYLTASCHCSVEDPTPLQSTPSSWPRSTKPSMIQHGMSLSRIPYSFLCHLSSNSSSHSAFFSISGTLLMLLPLNPDHQKTTPRNPGSAQIPAPLSPGPSSPALHPTYPHI